MSFISVFMLSLLACAPITVPAIAEDSIVSDTLNSAFDPALCSTTVDLRLGATADPPAGSVPADSADAVHAPFGKEGTFRFNIFGGGAFDFDENNHALTSAGVSYFIMDGLSLDGEINGTYIDQPGDSAWGGGFTLLFRWHLINEPTWTFYADGGAGILLTSEDVPQGTSNFNFTPQIGCGVSFDIGDGNRIMTGVRWYHMSNANTSEYNPGNDTALFYLGLSFPL